MKLSILTVALPLAFAFDQVPSVQEFPLVPDPMSIPMGSVDNGTSQELAARYLYCNAGYGLCSISGYCCQIGNSECCVDGCGPLGSECCNGGGFCYAGNGCYKADDGRRTCCTDSSCSAYVDVNGHTTTVTQTFTFRYTITYYTYYYYRATILESDFDYYSTTFYVYALNSASATATAESVTSAIKASLSIAFAPPPVPTLAPYTTPDIEPTVDTPQITLPPYTAPPLMTSQASPEPSSSDFDLGSSRVPSSSDLDLGSSPITSSSSSTTTTYPSLIAADGETNTTSSVLQTAAGAASVRPLAIPSNSQVSVGDVPTGGSPVTRSPASLVSIVLIAVACGVGTMMVVL